MAAARATSQQGSSGTRARRSKNSPIKTFSFLFSRSSTGIVNRTYSTPLAIICLYAQCCVYSIDMIHLQINALQTELQVYMLNNTAFNGAQ